MGTDLKPWRVCRACGRESEAALAEQITRLLIERDRYGRALDYLEAALQHDASLAFMLEIVQSARGKPLRNSTLSLLRDVLDEEMAERCRSCDGQGYRWAETRGDEAQRRTCTVCGGTGRIAPGASAGVPPARTTTRG